MPVEKLSVPLYVFVPDRELDFLTGSHVKLDTDCIDTDCIDKDCINTDLYKYELYKRRLHY